MEEGRSREEEGAERRREHKESSGLNTKKILTKKQQPDVRENN